MERREPSEQELAEFERKVKFAMQHRAAPTGLKQRVLARARERRQTGHGRIWILQRLAASIVLAGVVGGFAVYHQTEEKRKGEQAREQVMTALRITSRTLNRVNERLADSNH